MEYYASLSKVCGVNITSQKYALWRSRSNKRKAFGVNRSSSDLRSQPHRSAFSSYPPSSLVLCNINPSETLISSPVHHLIYVLSSRLQRIGILLRPARYGLLPRRGFPSPWSLILAYCRDSRNLCDGGLNVGLFSSMLALVWRWPRLVLMLIVRMTRKILGLFSATSKVDFEGKEPSEVHMWFSFLCEFGVLPTSGG